MKHYCVYDVCGEVIEVDAENYHIDVERGTLTFYPTEQFTPYENCLDQACFNWSNVICVREEEDDDDGDEETILPSWVPEVSFS